MGPDAYDTLYRNTVERIKKQPDHVLAMRVVSLVVWVRRPLTIQELQHALAITEGREDLDEESRTNIEGIA